MKKKIIFGILLMALCLCCLGKKEQAQASNNLSSMSLSVGESKGAKEVEKKIPKNAKQWNGHAYKIINLKMSPEKAQKYCEKRGGYLATITSKKEQDFLAKMAERGKEDNYFIGATDYGSEGEWRWMNGEKWKYTNWYPGGAAGLEEPNNGLGSGEDYAVINRERNWQWVDVYGGYDGFTNKNCFICEWDGYKIKLSKQELRMKPGASEYLRCSVIDLKGKIIKKRATWKSSNVKVAKVSSKGKIVAVAPGNCKIKCSSAGFQKTVKVLVLPKKVTNVSSVSKSHNSVQLKWKKQNGVKGYMIYMYDVDLEEFVKVKTVNGDFNTAYIYNLKRGKTYRFKVCAYIRSGSKNYCGDISKIYKVKTKKK